MLTLICDIIVTEIKLRISVDERASYISIRRRRRVIYRVSLSLEEVAEVPPYTYLACKRDERYERRRDRQGESKKDRICCDFSMWQGLLCVGKDLRLVEF